MTTHPLFYRLTFKILQYRVLESSRLDFGDSGPRFEGLRASILEAPGFDFRASGPGLGNSLQVQCAHVLCGQSGSKSLQGRCAHVLCWQRPSQSFQCWQKASRSLGGCAIFAHPVPIEAHRLLGQRSGLAKHRASVHNPPSMSTSISPGPERLVANGNFDNGGKLAENFVSLVSLRIPQSLW